MDVYLVQHALAREKEEDPTRSLSEKGIEDARRMADYAAEQTDLAIALIVHSGKTRAHQTAEIFAEALQPPLGVREAENMAPLDDPAIWAEELAEMSEDVMLVGHLPHLQRLASVLLVGDAEHPLVQFRNAGIVNLNYNESGDCVLGWALTPSLVPTS